MMGSWWLNHSGYMQLSILPRFMETGGRDWPYLINRVVTPAQEPTTIVLLITVTNIHYFILCVFVALWGWVDGVARINQVSPCVLPEYINHVVIRSSMFPCWTRWRVGAWLMMFSPFCGHL